MRSAGPGPTLAGHATTTSIINGYHWGSPASSLRALLDLLAVSQCLEQGIASSPAGKCQAVGVQAVTVRSKVDAEPSESIGKPLFTAVKRSRSAKFGAQALKHSTVANSYYWKLAEEMFELAGEELEGEFGDEPEMARAAANPKDGDNPANGLFGLTPGAEQDDYAFTPGERAYRHGTQQCKVLVPQFLRSSSAGNIMPCGS